MTKKYVVFATEDHEELGGMHDLVGSGDTVQECLDSIKGDRYDYYQIVDASTWEIVKEGSL